MIAAGITCALTTGSYLTWSASADERPAQHGNTVVHTINVDSLYTAKTQESDGNDSAFAAVMGPERTISGRVSWYGPGFHGRRTANGERFDRNEMTAAHKTLPFGTIVRVVDEASGHSVLVRVNDRGPYCGGRVLDLSEASAKRLGITGRGTASARLEIFAPHKGTNGEQTITFDLQGRAVKAHGYTVTLARIPGFDEAIARMHEIEKSGYTDLYLTQIRAGGKMEYTISTGLFASEALCGTLLAEVSDTFSQAHVASFDAIGDALATRLADTSTGDRGSL